MTSPNPINATGAFLPVEFDLPMNVPGMYEFMLKRERLTASLMNIKDIGQYEQSELLNGQTWFSTVVNPNRNQPAVQRYAFRKVFDVVKFNGAPIPVGTTITQPHGIVGIITPTRIFGTATTSTGKYYPLPFVDANLTTNDIEIYADNTNIYLITGATIDGGANTLTQAYFVFEYVKQ